MMGNVVGRGVLVEGCGGGGARRYEQGTGAGLSTGSA